VTITRATRQWQQQQQIQTFI